MTFVVGFSVRKELKYGIYSERCCPAFKGVLDGCQDGDNRAIK